MSTFVRVMWVCLVLPLPIEAAAPPGKPLPVPADYPDYRIVRDVIRSRVSNAAPPAEAPQPGYLGLSLARVQGKWVIQSVDPLGPASRMGLRVGDVCRKLDGAEWTDLATFAEQIRSRQANSKVTLTVERDGKPRDFVLTLAPISRPLVPGQRAVLGIQVDEVKEGFKLTRLTPGQPAEKANLKVGDILLEIDGEAVNQRPLAQYLSIRRGGEPIELKVKRGDNTFTTTAVLSGENSPEEPRRRSGQRGWDDRIPRLFTRPVYRLAVVPIEFPDVKHNSKIRTSDWEESLFSTGSYTRKSVTGQTVHGSMNDYYREQSCGQFRVEGKCFDWVTVKRNRADYGNDSNRSALLTEALDRLLSREGKEALKNFDGVYFLYAGSRAQARRGGLYWPHRANFNHQGKRWPYFICPEGGDAIASISVITHEFGHLLGLPDLYARPEVPGEEGLGVWCTMSTGHGRDGKPLHFSAWCKAQLGWVKPAEIDPRVQQKILLAPINGSTTECIKIPLRTDGSEYLLLENRRRIGFDRDLPAEGLLIWRVVDGRPILEESHG
ncbi:MAG: M6 family metalloprotease domain-containing protein, partial [Gemmataceae bacterium]